MYNGPSYAVSTNDVMAALGRAMSIEDASGAVSPICPTTDMLAYMDDSFGHAISTYDVMAMLGHAMPATFTPDVPSTTCPPLDATVDCASPVDAAVA